jgi:hypothetical protein
MSVAFYLYYAECCYAECCYAECRGTLPDFQEETDSDLFHSGETLLSKQE